MIRRGAVIKLLAIAAVAALVTTLVAVLIRWLPASASEEMDRITFTFWFATVICIGIFSVVVAVIVYSVFAFRAQPDDDTDGPPIHGHTGLEVAWTIAPAILVVAIGIVSAVVLSRNGDAGPNALHVKVFAQQFAWKFQYPDQGDVSSRELVLPVHRGIELQMESADVIHSFWIPEMGQKQDLVPGIQTRLVITPTKTGTFTLICTELCGLGHPTMRAPARVVSAAAFEQWAADQQRAQGAGGGGKGSGNQTGGGGGGQGGSGAEGKQLFATNGCGGCHMFTPAGSKGEIGPSLDNLAADAEKAGKPVDEYVRESIVDPNAYLVPSYAAGVMPQDFAKTLKPDELDALVQYLTGKES